MIHGNYLPKIKDFLEKMIDQGTVKEELDVNQYKTQLSSYLLLVEFIKEFSAMETQQNTENQIKQMHKMLLKELKESNNVNSLAILEELMVIDVNFSNTLYKLYQSLLKKQLLEEKAKIKSITNAKCEDHFKRLESKEDEEINDDIFDSETED